MNLNKFIEGLQEFLKEHPEAGELDVCTSADDEGNGFYQVYFSPSLGNFTDGDFKSVESIKESMEDDPDYDDEDEWEINGVCVN